MPTLEGHIEPARFSQRRLQGTLWAGVAISFCFLLFRFYVRLKVFRRLHIEDPFVLAAWLLNLANAVVWQKSGNKLYSVIAVGSGELSIPPPDQISQLYTELHSLFASELFYYTALWSVKLSFLLFFRKLHNDVRRQMILWYCVFVFTIASYIGCLCLINYKCLLETPGLVECQRVDRSHRVLLYLRLATALDTTTDGLIILMSINILWNASIAVKKKLALTGIFSLTIFIIGVSITRVVLTTSGPRLDLTWLLLWSGLEITVAIIVACLASFRILYTSSERSRRSALTDYESNRATEYLGTSSEILLNARVVSPTPTIASENTNHKRESSADLFEEAILPMENVYVQHKYSVFPGPSTSCEEKRSPPEIPVIRHHFHRIPSYTENQGTVW